jgi:DNA-binding beta-propeller fold protein YncE
VHVRTLAGSGSAGSSNGIGTRASFNNPASVAISRSGKFAVASERSGHRIRLIDLVTSQVTTLAGSGNNSFADGQGTLSSFSRPEGVAISPDDSFVLVAEGILTSSHRIRHIVIATGVVTTFAGSGAGYSDGVGTMAKFQVPRSIAFSPDGAYALVTEHGNIRVRRLDMTSKNVTTVAGSTQGFADGTGSNAKFDGMCQLAIDPSGSYALIDDLYNHRIRRLDIASAQVTTFVGSTDGFQDGAGTNAKFNQPHGVSIDPTGKYALIVDYMNQRIRRIDIASARVTTLAGTGVKSSINGIGAQATFGTPIGIDIDRNGAFALVADFDTSSIRQISLASPPCNAGFYCPAGSSSPTQATCGPGTFCAITGLSAALICPAGFFCAADSFTIFGAVDGKGTCVFRRLQVILLTLQH